jgi:paxillin
MFGTPSKRSAVCKRCHVDVVAEKCDTCNKGLVGEYIHALGGKFHRACFLCRACGAEVASRYVAHRGAPHCRGCHADLVAERCACGCGRGMTGAVTSALGRKFIEGGGGLGVFKVEGVEI